MDSISSRRPCFKEDNQGLASIADMAEAGFSGHHHPCPLVLTTRPLYHNSLQRRGSLRNLSLISSSAVNSTRSGRFYNVDRFEEINQRPHFLDACFLCRKPLGDNKDIFMYRGDTPFCSEECRKEQIEKDEAKENNDWNLSASMKALRKDQKMNSNSTTSPTKSPNYPFPTSTVAAA